jgi:hypothetical protein
LRARTRRRADVSFKGVATSALRSAIERALVVLGLTPRFRPAATVLPFRQAT